MKYEQKWTGIRIIKDGKNEDFPATVPGNIQLDYGKYAGFGDVMYGENCTKYEALENDSWAYISHLEYDKKNGESVWFVSGGIDYKYDILLNCKKI